MSRLGNGLLDGPRTSPRLDLVRQRTTTWLGMPLIVLIGLVAGYLAAHDAQVGLLLGGCLLALVYLTGAPSRNLATAAFLLLLLLPRSLLSPSDATDDVLRIVAVFIMVPFAMTSRPAPTHTVSAGIFGLEHLVVGYVVYASASTILHGQFGSFLVHGIATVLLVIASLGLASDCGAAAAKVCPWIFGALMVVSLLMGFLLPGVALRGERLRAFMANPNSLGAYAALALLVAVVLIRSGTVSVLLVLASFVVILWSGSRASALAAMAGLLVLGVLGSSRPRWLLAGAGMAAIGLTIMADLALFDGGLFREANTREASLNEALRVLQGSPLLGLGAAQETVEVASSPLRAIVHGGAVGLLGIVVMYAALVLEALRVRGALVALTVAGIVHSLAEGWFLSAVSPMLLVYLAVWIAFRHESSRVHESPSEAPHVH